MENDSSLLLLGVDPGLGTASPTGVSLFDTEGYVYHFDELWSDKKSSLHKRLHYIAEEVYKIGADADVICIESTVMRGKGGESLQRLVGSIISRFPETTVLHVQNTGVKKIIGGSGKADKAQVAEGVLNWFKARDERSAQIVGNLIESERWDVLDSMAIGIAGLQSVRG